MRGSRLVASSTGMSHFNVEGDEADNLRISLEC